MLWLVIHWACWFNDGLRYTYSGYGVELELGKLKKAVVGLKKNTGVKANTGAKTETGGKHTQEQKQEQVHHHSQDLEQFMVELKHPLLQVKYLLVEHLEIKDLIFHIQQKKIID